MWMSRGRVCALSKFVCAFGVCKRECAGRLSQGGLCAHLKYGVFLTGPTTRNSKRKAQDVGDVSGSAGSGSADVPGTHVCGFDVQEMCGYVQELRVFAGLVRVQMCQSLLCFWCV